MLISTKRQKDGSGCHRTVRSIQKIQVVYQALQDDPNVTARRNNCPNISKTPFNLMTKIDLSCTHTGCRYAISCMKEMRKEESSTANGCWESLNQAYMSQMLIGDEAIFQPNGIGSKDNVVVWI